MPIAKFFNAIVPNLFIKMRTERCVMPLLGRRIVHREMDEKTPNLLFHFPSPFYSP